MPRTAGSRAATAVKDAGGDAVHRRREGAGRAAERRTELGIGRETAPAALLHKLLQSMKQSETLMTQSAPRFGFVAFAETWNGRLAMLGFVIGLATELLTGQGILAQLGLN